MRHSVVLSPVATQTSPGGGELVVSGSVRSSIDGSVFDAVTQIDVYPGAGGDSAPHLGGLFDVAAGGLRVVEQDTAAHVYRLVGTGAPAEACAAAGLASPCLVSRMSTLAHERLVTVDQLAASLSGRIDVEEIPPPPEPLLSNTGTAVVATLVLLALAAALARTALVFRRLRRATPFGQVRVAAAEARRAIGNDRTLAPARAQIDELMTRATELERGRRASAARLAKLDPSVLADKREAWLRSQAPGAADALALLDKEAAEGDRLAADLGASAAGLERIAAALRIIPLRAREGQNTQARLASKDPVDELLGELETRDDAADEAERVVN